MSSATDPADKNPKAFKALGISVKDNEGNLRSSRKSS